MNNAMLATPRQRMSRPYAYAPRRGFARSSRPSWPPAERRFHVPLVIGGKKVRNRDDRLRSQADAAEARSAATPLAG